MKSMAAPMRKQAVFNPRCAAHLPFGHQVQPSRTVSAPYHSTCGGETAEEIGDEVWRSGNEPYLKRRSERSQATGNRRPKYYCDISPRFQLDDPAPSQAMKSTPACAAYLATYTTWFRRAERNIMRDATVESRTPSLGVWRG